MKSTSIPFDKAMFDIYLRAKKELKYNANLFLKMLTDRGGVDTAKYLINSPTESDGYTYLYLQNRLDLTVEAMVVENSKWHSLFTPEEIAKASKRLESRGYHPERK
jgi:hypothetical protein